MLLQIALISSFNSHSYPGSRYSFIPILKNGTPKFRELLSYRVPLLELWNQKINLFLAQSHKADIRQIRNWKSLWRDSYPSSCHHSIFRRHKLFSDSFRHLTLPSIQIFVLYSCSSTNPRKQNKSSPAVL